jgi:hypothetical protein
MKIAEWIFFAVAGWCAFGLLGTVVSLARNRRPEAVKNIAWVATVAGVYLMVLLAVSAIQKQRVVALGQEQCFGAMCFRVTGVDEVPGLVSGSPDRVIRVRIAIANHSRSAEEEPAIHAYLLDSRGRHWTTLSGLSGNHLTGRVAGGSEIVSQPMFLVASDATGLGLVLTHGSWQPRNLIIGDSDSLAHRSTVVALGR